MESTHFTNNLENSETATLKDYLNLIRNNLVPVIIIVVVSLSVSIGYAVYAPNIYKGVVTLKISKPKGDILNSPIMPEFQDFGNDRFISNEIEIMKSYTTKEKVARALLDSVHNAANSFNILLNKDRDFGGSTKKVMSVPSIVKMLTSSSDISQKRGLDIVELSAESTSPEGAALIANTYAEEYKNQNLELNRKQLTTVKNFLKVQQEEKKNQLSQAEEILGQYQEKGGIIALSDQAKSLIDQLSQFEAQKNAVQIDLLASDKTLKQLKDELARQNPSLSNYLESLSSEAYFKSLQDQLAKLEVNRDLAVSSPKKGRQDNSAIIKDYNAKIKDLKGKLNAKLGSIKEGVFSSSPEEVRALSQKIIDEEVKNQSLRTTRDELKIIVDNYDTKFNKLPKTSIGLARLERNRESLEKLYLLVEEKYQEALINEQSQPGNVLIVDPARAPEKPSKPNRMLIVLVGLVLGGGIAFGFVFIKNYLDNTIKTPEDIQNRNINVLAWIPSIESVGIDSKNEFEFIVAKKPDAIASEAFRALRTRVQLSKIDKNALKTILITSAAPSEGKTTVCINLAGTFAQANKKTLIIDADLRKPRIHTAFNAQRFPGLIDYLFDQVKLDEIIRPTNLNNLSYITSGTIPPNPSEMLQSQQMKDFLSAMHEQFDIVLMDSAPLIAVTDSEILATIADATILVVSSEVTETQLLEKSVELLRHAKVSFIGTVLNNYTYRSGYGSYYKYYYYYSQPTNGRNAPGSKVQKS